MPEPIVGYKAKVTIGLANDQYIAASYEIRGMGDDLDWSNFVDSFVGAPFPNDGFRRRRVGLQEAEVTLRQATWDNEAGRNPFQNPFRFRINQIIRNVNIFPFRDNVVRFYYFPYVICTGYNASGDVQALQPFDCTLKTDGEWYLPGDL